MLKALEDSGDEPEARAPDKGTTKPGGTDEEALAEAMKRRDQMVREYLERAQLLWDAGKLTDAYQQYQRALTLDPSCQLCLSRRERIQNEIAALVQRHMDEGIKAFKALRYDEAIESWELVLNLSPDPGSQPHQMATEIHCRCQRPIGVPKTLEDECTVDRRIVVDGRFLSRCSSFAGPFVVLLVLRGGVPGLWN